MRPTNENARKNFVKKNILRIRGFPKIEKFGEFEIFQNRQKKALKSILGPKWGVLGENGGLVRV